MLRWTAVRTGDSLPEEEYGRLLDLLPVKRRAEVRRIKDKKSACGILTAYALLRRELKLYHGISRPVIAYEKAGKPYLPEYPRLHFSISHSREYAVCAVSDTPVGTDGETVRALRDSLWRRVLTQSEYSWADGDPGRLFRLWTLKESYFKFTGTGLAAPLKSVEFTFGENGPVVNRPGVFAASALISDAAFGLCSAADAMPAGPEILPVEEILSVF
ncbi:MAG: 4'-phosphopantetheinyl transferase superfamily protein [Clostridiales bacterium]|nr:4'-phosphopantetheinyl transferase superfamily protein [Clostridiales bacterium]